MGEKKGKVLYVDDEEINLVNFRETLEDEFEVFTALSGEEALRLLAQEGEMALVISDQRMPGMTGIEFLVQVRERHPDSVRMILSGYTEIHELIEAINRAEVYRYFVKPWDEEHLRLTVGNAVNTYSLTQQIKGFLDERKKKLATGGDGDGKEDGR